jgi:hypothetical protein
MTSIAVSKNLSSDEELVVAPVLAMGKPLVADIRDNIRVQDFPVT